MNEKNVRTAKPVLVAAVLATVGWVSAGSLTPPVGPIASTMKDLATVEPRIPISATTTPGDADSLFRITQSGSYYLTGNIAGVSGKRGIEIVPNGVWLDLMGFELEGVAGSLNGIHVDGPIDVAVVNGSVRNWGQAGLYLYGSKNIRLANLRVSGNASYGIVAGRNAVVTGCTAYMNGSAGIYIVHNGSISNCAARENGDGGIFAGPGSTVTDCSVAVNGGFGLRALNDCTVTNCSASDNTIDGINADDRCTITNCSASFNTGDGIRVSDQCTLRGNTCGTNGIGGDGAGIHVTGSDNRLEGNNCTRNTRNIDVDLAGNFIARNTCSGNWDVVAGNVCLVVSAITSGAIVGNSGGAAPGSTDPNANFTY